jgi:hypothetical protein
MSGDVLHFLFFDHDNENHLKYRRTDEMLSTILIRQTLPSWQCIQVLILARCISKRTDDPRRRLELIDASGKSDKMGDGEFSSIDG